MTVANVIDYAMGVKTWDDVNADDVTTFDVLVDGEYVPFEEYAELVF